MEMSGIECPSCGEEMVLVEDATMVPRRKTHKRVCVECEYFEEHVVPEVEQPGFDPKDEPYVEDRR